MNPGSTPRGSAGGRAITQVGNVSHSVVGTRNSGQVRFDMIAGDRQDVFIASGIVNKGGPCFASLVYPHV